MSETVTVRGQSLKNQREKEREADLHHLRIFAHPAGTPEEPRWVVERHGSEDDPRPTAMEFSNGHDMLAYIADHASVPKSAHEPSDQLGRQVLPAELQNTYGRAR
jgi:hypothetical protein